MKEALGKFFTVYINSSNVFILTLAIMMILFIINFILFFFGTGSLKKIIHIMRTYSGDEIIRRIESLRLSRRLEKMWNDYYSAFCNEETVALSCYLEKKDMLISANVFRLASRATAIIGIAIAGIGLYKIPAMLEADKNNFICLIFGLIAIEAFLEIFYALLERLKLKRITRLLDEFEILSNRKLPGKASSFANMRILDKLGTFADKAESIRSGVTQLNARLDRQYKFLENFNKSENTEE